MVLSSPLSPAAAPQAWSPRATGPERYYLGIDGGGTGCRARLIDREGKVLGQGEAGSANLTLGIQVAVDAVLKATLQAMHQAGLAEADLSHVRAGLGLAAANVPSHREALASQNLPFASFATCSDAEAACLGAHGGADGAILILGTGSQGVLQLQGEFRTVGGWGHLLSDSGSGAMLGRAAVRRAFMAHEGVVPSSPLTDAIMVSLGNDSSEALRWAVEAKPRDWARHARVVVEQAALGDSTALNLMHENAQDVALLLDRLVALGARRISLMGGLAVPMRPYLTHRFDGLLVEAQGDAMAGALLLASRDAH